MQSPFRTSTPPWSAFSSLPPFTLSNFSSTTRLTLAFSSLWKPLEKRVNVAVEQLPVCTRIPALGEITEHNAGQTDRLG